MKIPKFFQKKSKLNPEKIRLFFNFNDANTVHSNNISKNVHTKKKYYYETFCEALVPETGTIESSISNIAIYVATSFIGTRSESLNNIVSRRQNDFTAERYPLFYVDDTCFAVYLKDIIKNCVDIHAELDHKDGKCMTKYIFHCCDNENDIDMYLVLYSDSVNWDIKSYLLNPDWIR